MRPPIYLDHHATTPIDDRVLKAMMPYLTEHYGNPSSKHHYGDIAYDAVENARMQVASLIGAQSKEIIFTSGATESNSLVIDQPGWMSGTITSLLEHSSVLENIISNSTILLSVKEIEQWLRGAKQDRNQYLVSVMLANNETGAINDLSRLSQICHDSHQDHCPLKLHLHTDASQGLGYVPFDVSTLTGIHYASISGHKIYGPKGVGALYINSKIKPDRSFSDLNAYLIPAHRGGGQERGLRAGTLNVPGIVGLGEACRIMKQEGPEEADRLASLRDDLYAALQAQLMPMDLQPNGASLERDTTMPQTLNLWLPGVPADQLTLGLNDIAISTGSACSAHSDEPSHVLKALYPDQPDRWTQSIRMAVGRYTTVEHVERAAKRISDEIALILKAKA